METTTVRPIYKIAQEIIADWKKIYFGAHPYIYAMQSLDTIYDTYGADSAKSIIRYFLGNAQTWRGETAKRIKLELKSLIK